MPQAKSSKPLQPSWRTSLIWIGLAATCWLTLKLLASVLTPFVVAAVLAYSLTPAVDALHRLTRQRLPRLLCVTLVEAAFALISLAVLLLVVPIALKELPLVQSYLPSIAERVNASLRPLLSTIGIDFSLDPVSIRAWALTYLDTNAEAIGGSVLSSLKIGGSLLMSFIGYLVLVPVVLFYLLADWSHLIARVANWIPRSKLPAVRSFAHEADAVLGQYMRGQLLVMLSLAVYYSAVLSLWRLDLALPIGVFTGLAICIPYVGFGLGLVLAALAALLQFDLAHAALLIGITYGAGQLLESFFLTPRLVGKRIGLHPLAVIFALLAFGDIFGLVGVLIALPLSAVLLVALRRAKAQYLASDWYRL